MGLIYLKQPDGSVIAMEKQRYETEDILQRLIAQNPQMIATEIDGTHEWLLISREMPIPGEETRMWLDHLFIDQQGIPTLIEVKRKEDTRSRREVVAQMLDYAAFAVVNWQIRELQAYFERRCEKAQLNSEQVLADFLQGNSSEAFWKQVETNLQAKKLRLLFVADLITPELRRIVEFLNEQMETVEVLAVEISQYVGQDNQTLLVPRLVGQTVAAQEKKSVTSAGGRQWNEESFFETMELNGGREAVLVGREILHWAQDRGLRIRWGQGSMDGSFTPVFDYRGISHRLFGIWNRTCTVEVQFEYYKAPFDTEEKRLQLWEQLNAIPGIRLDRDKISKRPGFKLTAVADEQKLARLLSIYEWYLQEIEAYT